MDPMGYQTTRIRPFPTDDLLRPIASKEHSHVPVAVVAPAEPVLLVVGYAHPAKHPVPRWATKKIGY